MSIEDDLGPLTRTYRTDDRRRRKRALRYVVVGAISTPPAVAFAIVMWKRLDGADGVGAGALGSIVGLAVSMLVVGAILFGGYWFSRDEQFHLYEHGLVRDTREGIEVIWWRSIHKVDPIWPNKLIAWGLGGDDGCRLRLTSGQTMYITGFTEDATELRRNIELKAT